MSFYGVHMPSIIESAARSHESEKKVADGIVQSAMMTPFQRTAMDGIIQSAMGDHSGHKNAGLMKTKASKTRQDPGLVHYPGSRYA